MGHYIDADKLLAEIEQKISICEKQRSDAIEIECYNLADHASARIGELHVIQETIASLQQEQPEVDIEKEITEHAENMPHGEFTHDSECAEHEEWAKREFYHFYELGLNARKDE